MTTVIRSFAKTLCDQLPVVAVVVGVVGLAAPLFGACPLRVEDDGKVLHVRCEDATVFTYRYGGDIFKPYVAELHLPKGKNVLRDSPHDHIHHHALMFAWNVDGIEFWGEQGKVGSQVHRGFVSTKPEAEAKRLDIVEQLDWVAPDGKTVVLNERRTITLWTDVPNVPRLLQWQSEFSVPAGRAKATITGRKYHGLGVRFVEPMDKVAKFITDKGVTDVKKVDGSRAPWCAVTGPVSAEQKITLAFFDAPDNPRHPATWFAMTHAFTYMSATIAPDKKPLVLEQGKTLRVRYGVALWDKTVDAQTIDKACDQWLERTK